MGGESAGVRKGGGWDELVGRLWGSLEGADLRFHVAREGEDGGGGGVGRPRLLAGPRANRRGPKLAQAPAEVLEGLGLSARSGCWGRGVGRERERESQP